MRIHVLEPEGDVLVFLTGQEEIEAVVRAVVCLCVYCTTETERRVKACKGTGTTREQRL